MFIMLRLSLMLTLMALSVPAFSNAGLAHLKGNIKPSSANIAALSEKNSSLKKEIKEREKISLMRKIL